MNIFKSRLSIGADKINFNITLSFFKFIALFPKGSKICILIYVIGQSFTSILFNI